jgi:nucleotide-binding universal stress UspA family protein
MAMPPSLRWALNRLPLGKDERKRLEREDFEETAFVPSLERILVAADESAKGKFASRVAGLLAGLRGMPVTVLKIESPAESKTKAEKESAAGNGKDGSKSENVEAATDAAEEGKAADPHQKAKGAAVDVIEQQHDATPHEAVKKEAEKGHDLLLVGIEPTEGGKGGFDDKVSAIARGFAGALAVVIARGVLERDPLDSELSILVATDGSAVSQRGAELAIVLAKAAGAKVAALVVTRPGAGTARQRLSVTRVASKEILKEVAALAKHYDVSVDTVERTGASAAEAILREARQGGHDLIVIGASRRPGEKLSFGSTAAAILESSDRSIMFVSS